MTAASDPESVIERAIRALDRLSRDFKRRTVWFAGAIVVLVIASTVMGITAYRNAESAQAARREAAGARVEANRAAAALSEYKTDNERARVFSCKKANAQTVRDRDAFVDTATVLVAQLRNPTPEQAAAIARYVAAQRKKAVEDFPFRDCSTRGIAEYLGQTP